MPPARATRTDDATAPAAVPGRVRAQRFDVGTLGEIERTHQGGIRVPAHIAKVGILPYEDATGRRWKELHPPASAFDPGALKSLRDATVTHLHPPAGKVTAETHSALSKGHVGDVAHREGPYVDAPVVVQDAA